MRLVLVILLVAVLKSQGSVQKEWSDWLSEGESLRATRNNAAATQAFREALTIAERSHVSDLQLVVLDEALAGAYADAGNFAESEAAPPVMEFVSSGEGLQLSLAFMKIKDPKVRKRVLDLVKSLAEEEAEP